MRFVFASRQGNGVAVRVNRLHMRSRSTEDDRCKCGGAARPGGVRRLLKGRPGVGRRGREARFNRGEYARWEGARIRAPLDPAVGSSIGVGGVGVVRWQQRRARCHCLDARGGQ